MPTPPIFCGFRWKVRREDFKSIKQKHICGELPNHTTPHKCSANGCGNIYDASNADHEAMEELCTDCGHPKNDSRFHLEAPGTNWGAALHNFKPAEQPAPRSLKGKLPPLDLDYKTEQPAPPQAFPNPNKGDGRQYCMHCNNRIYYDATDALGAKWRHHATNFTDCYGGAEQPSAPPQPVGTCKNCKRPLFDNGTVLVHRHQIMRMFGGKFLTISESQACEPAEMREGKMDAGFPPGSTFAELLPAAEPSVEARQLSATEFYMKRYKETPHKFQDFMQFADVYGDYRERLTKEQQNG